MIEIYGKRNSAVVYAEKIDKAAKTQLAALLRASSCADAKIRVMPDVHAGRGTLIGLTMTIGQRLNPLLLGMDIGCGMEAVFLEEAELDLPALDDCIRREIPCGAKIRSHPLPGAEINYLQQLHSARVISMDRARRSIGTLGSGNHFIELDRGEDGRLIMLIHSGSRQIGAEAAKYWQEQANRRMHRKNHQAIRQASHERRLDEDEYTSVRVKAQKNSPPHREEAILEGEDFRRYCEDVVLLCRFAEENRRAIADILCRSMKLHIRERFSCVHNYIDTEHGILRKGAVSARLGERLLLPLNMRDGTLLCRGLGNPEWNFSSPHGAGRIASREDVRHAWTLEQYRSSMEGIFTTTATAGSLDECPMAYKAPADILAHIGETVTVEAHLHPVYNFKAD